MEVIPETRRALIIRYLPFYFYMSNMRESKLSHASTAKSNKGNNKITELRTILQRESQNS